MLSLLCQQAPRPPPISDPGLLAKIFLQSQEILFPFFLRYTALDPGPGVGVVVEGVDGGGGG